MKNTLISSSTLSQINEILLYSRTCYEQPLLWTANLLLKATWTFPKMAFCIQITLPSALKGHFSCVSRVAVHSRFYCIYDYNKSADGYIGN